MRVVQEIVVMCSVNLDCTFDPIPFGHQRWRGIQRWIKTRDAPEWKAVELDIDRTMIGVGWHVRILGVAYEF